MPVTLKQVKTLVINRATECKFIGNALNLFMQLAPKIMILRGGIGRWQAVCVKEKIWRNYLY